MIASILLPLLVCIVGALVYALSANPKMAEMGRLAFGSGLLAICLYYAGRTVNIG